MCPIVDTGQGGRAVKSQTQNIRRIKIELCYKRKLIKAILKF
jgi:hypothetical protein